jgi:ribosomal protein S18 acetylase RimI-like enzyme
MIEITEMRITDYDAVRALLQGTPGLTWRSADSRAATERYLTRNPGLRFVARSRDRIVGCVMCGHDGRRGYLQYLVVEPHLRRQGIGTKLVRSSLSALEALGIEKTHIDVLLENFSAHAYWANAGWQKRTDIIRYSHVASTDVNA